LDEFNKKFASNITSQDLEAIKYIPNSRFAYYNKLIKTGIADGLSTADIDYVDTVWMNDESKRAIKKILSAMVKQNKVGYTVNPTPPRSGIRVSPGNVIQLRNPGRVYTNRNDFRNDVTETTSADQTADELIESIDESIKNSSHEIFFPKDIQKVDYLADAIDPYIADAINEIISDYEKYGGFKISKADNLIETVRKTQSGMTNMYAHSLLHPQELITAKIPALIPQESTTFQAAGNLNITTNASGNVCFLINPFLLYSAAASYTGMSVCNDVTLTGLAACNFFTGVQINTTPPANLYSRYRLVSAKIKMTYQASNLNASGRVGLSVVQDPTIIPNQVTAINAFEQKYGNFSLIDNGMRAEISYPNRNESVDAIYLPPDDTYFQFQTMIGGGIPADQINYRSGELFAGYVAGAPGNTAVINVQYWFNYECIVDPVAADYIHRDVQGSPEDQGSLPLDIARRYRLLRGGMIGEMAKTSSGFVKPSSEKDYRVQEAVKKDSLVPVKVASDAIQTTIDKFRKGIIEPLLNNIGTYIPMKPSQGYKQEKQKELGFFDKVGDSVMNAAKQMIGNFFGDKLLDYGKNVFLPGFMK
jgi:hypothetical protein